jgi:hypothetical protein
VLDRPDVTLDFRPTVSFTEQYTDNFRLGGDGRTENLRSSLNAGFTLLLNRPLTQGTISTSLGASHDTARGTQDFRLFPTLTASVRHTFSERLSVTVADSFRRDDDPGLAESEGLRRERREFTANTFSVSLGWLLDRVATQTYYRNSLFLGTRDTVGHILGANARTPVGPLMNLSGGYEYTLRETDSRETTGHRVFASLSRQLGYFTTAGVSSSYSLLSGTTDSRIWNGSLFTTYGTPAGLSLSASLGVSLIDRDTGATRTGLSSQSTASYRFARGVVSLGFSQDFRQTADEGEDFGTVATRAVRASASYELTPFMTATTQASFSRNEPTGDGNNQADAARNLFRAGAGLSWRMLSWLRLNLDYSYSLRTSDTRREIAGGDEGTGTPERDISENRATLTLSASF